MISDDELIARIEEADPVLDFPSGPTPPSSHQLLLRRIEAELASDSTSPAEAGPNGHTRWLAVAAVLLLVAGTVTVSLMSRRSDDQAISTDAADDQLSGDAGTDLSAAEWLKTAKQLAEKLEHHLDEEEKEVFPVAGKVLTDEQKEQLAAEYHEDMERRRSNGS